jgi:hypothetical protein
LQTSGSAVRLIAADGWGTDSAILRLTRAAGKQGKVSSPNPFGRSLSSLEKVACGAFSDISSVSAGKKRGFCRLGPP